MNDHTHIQFDYQISNQNQACFECKKGAASIMIIIMMVIAVIMMRNMTKLIRYSL